MKKLITFTLFLVSASFLGAQVVTDDYYSASKPKLLSADRVSASISAGAGVSFLGSSNNTAFTTFIAPKIGYQVSEKFKLNVGLMHYSITGNTFMPLNQNELTNFNAGLSVRIGPFFIGSGSLLSAALGNSKQADFHFDTRAGC